MTIEFFKDENYAKDLFRKYENAIKAMMICERSRPEADLGIAVDTDEYAVEWQKQLSIKRNVKVRLENMIDIVSEIQQHLGDIFI